jgi:predicted nucleotide-binding protein
VCLAIRLFGYSDEDGEQMLKTKIYRDVRFSADAVKEVMTVYEAQTSGDDSLRKPLRWQRIVVRNGNESWNFDSVPEFIGAYAKPFFDATVQHSGGVFQFHMFVRERDTELQVGCDRREVIETVFNVLDLKEKFSKLPPETKPVAAPKPLRVFIGHGGNSQWRDLKDHLHDKHQIAVEAYEVGARAGHTIRDILTRMLGDSTFACLVLTGEDETTDGRVLARQNVIHEAGLFQGRLGFSRAIILLEEGTDEFSNVSGVQQIRFSKNNIKETFGDVLATIKREFPGR